MPTVIVIDVSLSMTRPITFADTSESYSRLNLGIHGINVLLDYLAIHSKLEFVSLIAFSSLYDIISNFTRDFDSIKTKLQQLEEYDKTCVETALHGVTRLVLGEWGNTTPCQIVLVTDGSPGMGPMSLKHSISSWNNRDSANPFPLPFPFPGKLNIMCISPPDEPNLIRAMPLWNKLTELAGSDSTVYVPEDGLTIKSVQSMFQKLAENNFSSFQGTLKCGNLFSKIILSPSPQSYKKITDFDFSTRTISDTIEVCGFLNVSDVGSPMSISRHLILPQPTSARNEPSAIPGVKLEIDSDEDVNASLEEGKVPSFCVLLHGALKVENMAALCLLANDWFGIVYSWADSKKKSNLMLTILEPGSDAVPWLGNLNRVCALEEIAKSLQPNESPSNFPVRPAEKRSYSQNCVVWIRQAGIQTDIQKILRQARKLPEKLQQFYKELNRVRRAAISLGFVELLSALADILDRECTLLPGTSSPDCALQLTHVASWLRKPQARDFKNVISPLSTEFQPS